MNNSFHLSRIVIFDCLTPEDLEHLEQTKTLEHMDLIPAGTPLQTPDKRMRGLYFVKEGKLRLYRLNAAGRAFTIDILGMGNMFGEVKAMPFGTHDMFIETIEDTRLCRLVDEQFDQLLGRKPELAIRFLKMMGDLLKDREEMLASLAIGNMTEQVLHVLIKLGKQFGDIHEDGYYRIGMKLTHQEIADMVGIRRETVTGLLKQLAHLGIVRTRRQSILIHLDRAESYVRRPSMDHASRAFRST